MLIFLNPKQSLLQAQIVDPDGFRRRRVDSDWEIELAAQLLQSKFPKVKRKKRKDFNFKSLLQDQLRGGATVESAVEAVANEALQASPQFEFTEAVKAEVDAVVAEYYAKLAAQKRKRKNKKAMKVLFLLATMEDE